MFRGAAVQVNGRGSSCDKRLSLPCGVVVGPVTLAAAILTAEIRCAHLVLM